MAGSLRAIFTALIALMVMSLGAHAIDIPLITFASSADYDNTANVVNAGPTPVNNQSGGQFRDVFWWGNGYGGGSPGTGSPDYINRGNSLLLQNNHAGPDASSPYTALNFTGQKIPNGGQTFLSIYDKTPGDGTATRNTFDASQPGGIKISADVLFANPGHQSYGGVVSMYNEGHNGLGLLAYQGGGNNPDIPKLSLVWQSAGSGTTLTSVSLTGTSFDAAAWFRVEMSLTVSGTSWTMNGSFFKHSDPTNPGSDLGSLITTLNYSGSLSVQDLINPGEVGLMAGTTTGYSDGVATDGTGANPGTDNIGVSITRFGLTQGVPDGGATLTLLGLAVLGLASVRRQNAKVAKAWPDRK
jgi:hypothetical protein